MRGGEAEGQGLPPRMVRLFPPPPLSRSRMFRPTDLHWTAFWLTVGACARSVRLNGGGGRVSTRSYVRSRVGEGAA